MAKNEKDIKISEDAPEQAQKAPVAAPAPEVIPVLDFHRALMNYRNPAKKEMLMKHRASLKVHAKQLIPSLLATAAEWNKLFNEF